MCVLVTTPFFPGNHIPTRPSHVALLCDQLSLLHAAGKSHGADVLCQNVRFWVVGDEAKTALIDYDYPHLPMYPAFWNTGFPKRHPEAKRNVEVILAEHDMYAAIAILCLHFKFRESDQQEYNPMRWSSLTEN